MIIMPTDKDLRNAYIAAAISIAASNPDWENVLADAAITRVEGDDGTWSYIYMQTSHSAVYLYLTAMDGELKISKTNPCPGQVGHVKAATTLYDIIRG